MNFISLILGGKAKPHAGNFHFLGPRKYKNDYIAHHQRHVQTLVGPIEERRLEALESYRKRARMAVLGSVLIAALAYVLIGAITRNIYIFQTVFVGFVLCLLLFSWSSKPIKHYNADIKNSIFPKIFDFFGDDFSFHERSNWSLGSLEPSGLLPHYNESSTEDLVSGTYNGVGLKLMEAKLVCVSRDSKGRTTRTTVFKGIFILLAMNKAFQSKTIVKRDQGMIGNWFGNKFSSLENVALEDPVFEKEFQVYSNDQIEARYLLTTSFMERLLSINNTFDGESIQCSFYEQNVLMMIASKKNRFEPGSIYKPATLEHEVQTLLTEMDEIFNIIETLRLDEKTRL